jgi:WNK lysine deficient protein kinase
LLKSLSHQNILGFRGAWVKATKQEVVFITENTTGGSLKQYLKKIKNPFVVVIRRWCRSILKGLDYLHSHDPPITHQDLKCDNLFVNVSQGECVIGDIGHSMLSLSYAGSV